MMMNGWIVRMAICFAYYIMGGFATTNMLRLLKGSYTPVLASACHCDVCGNKINIIDQLPIVSYYWNHGKCRYCNSPIPKGTLILEVLIFCGMSIVSALLHFSVVGVLCSFLFYEIVKWGLLLKCGRRESDFLRQYVFSLLGQGLLFLLVFFMAALLHLI